MLENPEVLQRWTSDAALYLYHYKRYCVNIEDEDEDGFSLFDEDNDASKLMYDHQERFFMPTEVVECVVAYLRSMMQTTGVEVPG